VLSFALAKPGWIIKSVILINEVLFEGDSYAVYPDKSTAHVAIPLKAEKNQELILDIKVLVGAGANSQHFMVFHEPAFIFKRFANLRYILQE
jgi:Bardet-Biedl syndrome 2 protein